MNNHVYLITYDISRGNIRTKVATRLIAEGYERIQYSVYLGIHDPLRNKALWKFLTQYISDESSSVGGSFPSQETLASQSTENGLFKLYIVTISQRHALEMIRLGDSHMDIDYICGNLRSLIF